MNIIRREPNVLTEVSRMLQNAFEHPGDPELCDWYPKADVKEEAERFIIVMDVPGMSEDSPRVSVQHNTLIIEGQREQAHEEKTVHYTRRERSVGRFSRQFTLPSSADMAHIQAEKQHGVLTIVIPKRSEATTQYIDVVNK